MKRLACLCILVSLLQGCTAIRTAYKASGSVLADYCALPDVIRKANQLVILGKTYDHSVCDLLEDGTTLAAAAQEAK